MGHPLYPIPLVNVSWVKYDPAKTFFLVISPPAHVKRQLLWIKFISLPVSIPILPLSLIEGLGILLYNQSSFFLNQTFLISKFRTVVTFLWYVSKIVTVFPTENAKFIFSYESQFLRLLVELSLVLLVWLRVALAWETERLVRPSDADCWQFKHVLFGPRSSLMTQYFRFKLLMTKPL